MSGKEFMTENILQDKRKKNWFWDSNEIFASNLSSYGKLVRLYLARCANSDRQAWPSYTRIAKDCGVSRDTAKRAIAELEEKGWIKKTVQRKHNGEYYSNIYFLCDPPEKVSLDDEGESGEEGGCSQHPPLRYLGEGGSSQPLPPRNCDRVGAHSTHVGAEIAEVGAHYAQVGADNTRVGAHSTHVGAEAACNNTNITIPIEQDLYIQPSIHYDDNNHVRAKKKDKLSVGNVDSVDLEEESPDTTIIKSLLKAAGFEGSQMEIDYIARWTDSFPADMIEHALKKSVLNGKKNLLYVGGIFESWLEKDVKTMKEAEKESRYDLNLKVKEGKQKKEGVLDLPDHNVFDNYLKRHGGG